MERRSVFISFAEEDIEIAKILKDEIEKRGVEIWLYTRDNPHGNDIAPETIRALEACDHLLIVLSPASKESEWVSRELGFIYDRRKKSNGLYPNIVGVRFNSDSENYVLNVKDFDSSNKTDECDFGPKRCFDIKPGTADSFDDLAKFLKPTITHIEDVDNPDQMLLLERSFDCYQSLFPKEEQDSLDDIKHWLEISGFNRNNKNYKWFDIWSVLHIKDYPIGISFLTIHKDYPLWFGNYLGVKPDFRQNNRAKDFLTNVIEHAQETFPKTKGILFEVDPVNIDFLEEVSNFLVDDQPPHKFKVDENVRTRSGVFFNWLDEVLEKLPKFEHLTKEDVTNNIRFLRRLWFYDKFPNTHIILDNSGKPLPYWQPAMCEPLNEKNEQLLYFMVYLFDGYTEKDIDLPEVADFIYDDFYGSAYGNKNSAAYIEGYENYLPTIKNRFVTQLSQGWSLGQVPRSRKIRMLQSVLHNVAPKKIAL